MSEDSQACMVDELDEALLRPEYMKAAKLILQRKYRWFQHLTAKDNIAAIRKSGLEPRRDLSPLPHIVSVWGGRAGSVICLWPVGSTPDEKKGTSNGPFAKLVLGCEHLPDRLTTDWTYGYTNTETIVLRYPKYSHPEIIVAGIEDRGSVLIYEALPVGLLRVSTTKTNPDNHSEWPLLVDVEDADVQGFDDELRRVP
jgi:hypothetical protein